MMMTCWQVRREISACLDKLSQEMLQGAVGLHLRECEGCSKTAEGQLRMRQTVQSLPMQVPPADFLAKTLVQASRQRATGTTWLERTRTWAVRLRLVLHNLMQPLALPAAGGLCSALCLFTILVPNFSGAFRFRSLTDVPTGLSTVATVKSLAPIGFQYGDAEVDLRIDDQGRIVNYSIVGGQGREKDALHRSIENNLLFTQFTPATAFGVPVTGTLRLSFRCSRIDVKG